MLAHLDAMPGVERVGRDWGIVYRVADDLPCLACGAPTRLRLCFTGRSALALCGRCRGY